MRIIFLVVSLLLATACSDDKSGLTPAERAKKGRGMSEEIWKVYSGTESGVAEDKPKADQPPAADQSKGKQ